VSFRPQGPNSANPEPVFRFKPVKTASNLRHFFEIEKNTLKSSRNPRTLFLLVRESGLDSVFSGQKRISTMICLQLS